MTPEQTSVNLHQPVRVSLVLDARGTDVNAVAGTLIFPSDRLTLDSVSDADSIINFWVVAPQVKTSGEIDFSGIIPGGFRATGTIISFVLVPRATGTVVLGVASATLLANDGEATPLPIKTVGAEIAVGAAEYAGPSLAVNSQAAPESFTPLLGQDPAVYDGRYFLAFATTDKGSGIDHYEITEVPAGVLLGQHPDWHNATSPYLLEDQTLGSDLYVRAINHAGVATVVEVSAVHLRSGAFSWIWIWIVLPALVVVLLGIWMARKRK